MLEIIIFFVLCTEKKRSLEDKQARAHISPKWCSSTCPFALNEKVPFVLFFFGVGGVHLCNHVI